MMHTCRCPLLFGKIAMLLAMALLLARPSSAQVTEVQVMVSGSWDYVEDPNPENDPNPDGKILNRIVLVAPQTASHGAFTFSGNDATKFAQKDAHSNFINPPLAKTGIYYLDVNQLVQDSGLKPLATDLQPLICPAAQPVRVSKIKNILYTPNAGMPRFAVSLPEPDYYSTYGGPKGSGVSESKVDTKPITPQTADGYYTTWMVLHYGVKRIAGAALTAILDDKTNFPQQALAFSNDDGSSAPIAISIVMGAAYGQNNVSCDSFSQQSFDHSTALWGLTRYASFPAEDINGVQHPGAYHYGCSKPPLANGSADCHSCQMSINGIVH